MAFGPKHCACCGASDNVETHHLYATSMGCPDDLTVWLCQRCHDRTHQRAHCPLSQRELTMAGLARAQARGVRLGRPRVSATLENVVKRHLAAGTGILKTARLVGVGCGTVQRIKAEMAA